MINVSTPLVVRVVTMDEIRSRRAMGRKRSGEVSFEKTGVGDQRSVTMKVVLNAEYAQAIRAFVDLLNRERATGLAETEPDVQAVAVSFSYESGRKYDKIWLGSMKRGETAVSMHVVYFVERDGGNIYGAKSDTAPNLRHWYGALHTVGLWDWSGVRGVPKDEEKAGVRRVGGYGEYGHYAPKK